VHGAPAGGSVRTKRCAAQQLDRRAGDEGEGAPQRVHSAPRRAHGEARGGERTACEPREQRRQPAVHVADGEPGGAAQPLHLEHDRRGAQADACGGHEASSGGGGRREAPCSEMGGGASGKETDRGERREAADGGPLARTPAEPRQHHRPRQPVGGGGDDAARGARRTCRSTRGRG